MSEIHLYVTMVTYLDYEYRSSRFALLTQNYSVCEQLVNKTCVGGKSRPADHTRVTSLSLPPAVDSRDRQEISFMVDDSHSCAVRAAAGVVMVWHSRATGRVRLKPALCRSA